MARRVLDPRALVEAWRRDRFEYLELALDLPDLLPEPAGRLRDGAARRGAPPAPAGRWRWLPLGGAFRDGLAAAHVPGARHARKDP